MMEIICDVKASLDMTKTGNQTIHQLFFPHDIDSGTVGGGLNRILGLIIIWLGSSLQIGWLMYQKPEFQYIQEAAQA
jgi:hypothetical protein